MQPADFERFRDLMRGMGRIFTSEPDKIVLDVYWLTLRSWSIEDFEAAVGHLMATAKFMPRPADFTAIRRAAEPTTGEAWMIALQKCSCWRDGATPGGRIYAAAAAVGGYRAIAFTSDEDLPFIERRFKTAYEELSVVDVARESVPQIAAPRSQLGMRSVASLLADNAPAPKLLGVQP